MGKLKPAWPQVDGFKVKMVHVSVECPECGGKKRSCDTCGPKGIVEKWVPIEDLKRSLEDIKMNHKTGKVHSSHGTFIIDLSNGQVISSSEIENSFGTIPIKFDLEEYHNTYPEEVNEGEFDVLDIGYWLSNKAYVEPDSGFRDSLRQ